MFKRIGDGCGGFVAADENSFSSFELQWAWILVKCVDREFPSTAHIVVGSGCYFLQLWWESSPWFTQVVPAGSFGGRGVAVAQGREKKLVEHHVFFAVEVKGRRWSS